MRIISGVGELKDSELLCLADSLYHHECYLMLLDVIAHHKEKFAFADDSLLQELEPDDALMGRFSRIGVLKDA